MVVPMAVGLFILGSHGVGGENTDVLAHLFGWLSGVVIGVLETWRMKRRSGGENLDVAAFRA
jgi:membrane associated rhomboid family serine protease